MQGYFMWSNDIIVEKSAELRRRLDSCEAVWQGPKTLCKE